MNRTIAEIMNVRLKMRSTDVPLRRIGGIGYRDSSNGLRTLDSIKIEKGREERYGCR